MVVFANILNLNFRSLLLVGYYDIEAIKYDTKTTTKYFNGPLFDLTAIRASYFHIIMPAMNNNRIHLDYELINDHYITSSSNYAS
jgi:hypothetical protein